VVDLAGHPPELRSYEVTYARILMLGAFPVVLMATLSSFFAGRGQTAAVLYVNIFATLVNVVLDYFWIFGKAGFPRAGVAGAAYATVISQVAGALVFFAIIVKPAFRKAYRTLTGWRPEPPLFFRLLRFGLPTGLQYSLEILAFAIFMMIVGRIGTDALAASGIAFNLNMLVFMPMMGLALGVSSLVGRYQGAEQPALAERTVWSAFWVSFAYMTACGLLYVFGSGPLLAPYAAGADPPSLAGGGPIAAVLLRFVALYSIFDMMNLIFAAGLKGAGDTVYPLKLVVVLSWVAMLVPAYFLCVVGEGGVYVAWWCATAYVVFLGLLMLRRFRAGGWKRLRIIEPRPAELEPAVPGLV
jgi:MATE family multidrug resistance protein